MTRPTFRVPDDRQIVVTGSLAFDQIMVFQGNFKDHILPEKLHVINISFLVSEMKRQRGGCAGNIAYTLALLGHESRIVATAGSDFNEYNDFLSGHGVDTEGIEILSDHATASCFITSDQSDNQITGFYPGAMGQAGELSLAERAGERAGVVIVAPDDPAAMSRHCKEARDLGLPFIFDPSFQVTAMEGEELAEAARGAAMLVVNDYEFAVFEKKTGKKGRAVFDLVDMAAVTLGGEGSKLLLNDGTEILVPAAEIAELRDPTGAGDAYRSGFVAGLQCGYDLEVCGRMGSVASAFVVEQNGTQSHAYTRDDFVARYETNFGTFPS
ncbi:MAG: carbohydrate kinase family protein [Thermoanaerobaculia bacterium]|nr:carbohydrate kinase family protein [Thermoanaerobaculia bacterium]